MIRELQVAREHLGQLEDEIKSMLVHSREGQILQSIPGVGPIQAATIIASIGSIANFEKASELKSYFGWAPQIEQTGISADHEKLTKRGTRTMKQMLYLMTMRAVQGNNEWSRMYHGLVPRMCSYDEKLKDYRGKLKPLGRIAGQMASMIFALLKTDQELLAKTPLGQDPPAPMLYDPEIHRSHRAGHYRSLKPGTLPRRIIQLPKRP